MKNRRVLVPVLVSLIIGLFLIIAVVILVIFTASQANNAVVNSGNVTSSLPKTLTTLPVVKQVIGANLEVTGNLNTQSIITADNISADSITAKKTIKASSITFAKTNGATAANQLYVTADGSLNYYDGTKRTNLTDIASSVSQLLASAVSVQNVGGLTGTVSLGAGLTAQNGQLTNSGVTGIAGSTGNITLGTGLAMNGNTLTSTGVTSVVSGSSDILVSTDENGIVTVSQAGSGASGTVALGPVAAQVDPSTNSSIWINKTGSGNLIQLSTGVSPVNRFVVDQTGAIVTGSISFSQLTNMPSITNTIGGASGTITLGNGLTVVGQSLSNSGVLSVGGLTSNIGLGSGLTISGNNIVATGSGVGSVTGTPNQVIVSGSGALTLSLPQDIATTSSPTFAALTLSTALPILSGGTGATNATGARTNLGAAASGANNDITSLTALTTITSPSALTIGATTQSLTLQGSSISISEHSGSFTSTLSLVAPTANVTYQLQTAAAGTYDVCTTAANCVGIGGGVTTPGGTIGTLSKFTSGSAIGDSIITDNGTTVSIAGTLSVNTITPTAAAIIGATTQSLTLQGAATTLTSTSGSYTNTLSFTTPSGSNKSIVIPNASGTIAVSAAGPLAIDALGNLSCPTCLTTGGSGGSAGVSSVNTQTGAITIASITASSIVTSSGTITIQDASSTVKGLASFNSTNLTVTNGAVNTIQGISTTASPTFTGLTLTNALSVASGGTGLGSTPLSGQLLIGNGTDYTLNTLTAGSGITIDNSTPGQITINAAGGSSCPTCANQTLDNLNAVAINTSLLPGITNTIDLGSATYAYRNGYVAGVFQTGSIDAITAATLSIGATNATAISLEQSTTIAANKSLTANGSALFQDATNSTTAFQIQNATGTSYLTADTTNGSIAIGSTAFSTTASFANKVDYATGTNPDSVAIADFNGDGKQDLATADYGLNKVSVLINSGTGTFAAKVDYTTGTYPYSIIAADFNSDSKPDLAVANYSSNTVSVFINSGTGAFAAKVDYVAGAGTQSVAAGDFNGDGKIDLATANSTAATVSVFINSGTGTFAAKVDYTANSSPRSVTITDLNGDNRPDIVTISQGAAVASVFINSGTGTFAGKVDYTVGTDPLSVVSADFNGDGKPDLAAVNFYYNTVSVLMNNGNGTFAAKVDYAVGTNPRSAVAVDLNGDGKPDIAVANGGSDTISVLINNGNGTFATKVDYITGSSPRFITAADANSDGSSDLIVSNVNSNTVSIFINSSTAPNQLAINNLTTVGSTTAQVAISTSATSNKGLIIQGMNSQTADLFQTQNSSGTVLVSISAAGALSVVSATITVL